jgi:hypothetical protein
VKVSVLRLPALRFASRLNEEIELELKIASGCSRCCLKLGAGLALALAQYGMAYGQYPYQSGDLWQYTAIASDFSKAILNCADSDNSSFTGRSPRIPMFGMLPGFLTDPPELSAFDDPADETGPVSNSVDGVVLSFGNDNPFLDPRRPGDPGGVGFIRVHSQVQVVNSGNTSVCLGLRAWTPAGMENGGVQNRPTVLAPGIGIFQDLGSGTALQGFVDQSFHGGGSYQGPVRYGMAVNCPLAMWESMLDRSVFFFVQALGTYDYGSDRQGRPMNWEIVPGIHWRLSDYFWLSLGASKSSILTCRWQF